MDFAFILDPLPLLKAYKDSSVAMMRALAARGHRLYALTPAECSGTPARRARGSPRCRSMRIHDWYTAGAREERALSNSPP